MFHVKHGWLEYSPFKNSRLPEIVEVRDENTDEEVSVPFVDRRTNKTLFERPLFRLSWPGEMRAGREDVRIPLAIVSHWSVFTADELERAGALPLDSKITASLKTPASRGKVLIDGVSEEEEIRNLDTRSIESSRVLHPVSDAGIPLGQLVREKKLPDELPESVAYHLAVNHRTYAPMAGKSGVFRPVAGLPARIVNAVLDARFAFDNKAIPALIYLKWLAETHRPHPLLTGFDTNIREMLLGINEEATRLFFSMVFDYQYDRTSSWWARGESDLDPRFATYLHWVGKTGMGLYGKLSGIGHPLSEDEVSHLREFGINGKAVPDDVKERMREWNVWQSRQHLRDDGEVSGFLKPERQYPLVNGDELMKKRLRKAAKAKKPGKKNS